MQRDYGLTLARLQQITAPIAARFGEMVALNDAGLRITPQGRPLTRMIAQMLDRYDMASLSHSTAI